MSEEKAMAREEAYQKQIRELMNRLVGCGSKFAIKCCVQKLEGGGSLGPKILY